MPDGRNSMAYGLSNPEPEKINVINLDLRGLPSQADEQSLRKMTGARHIIKA